MNRRRTAALLGGVVAAACLALAGAAWTAAPPATQLDARVAQRLAAFGARPVPLAEVPPAMVKAVVATEDERFYRHHGIDVIGALRALPYDVSHLSLAQGASTISEQLAKLLYLGGNDHNPWRKLEDAAVAWKLEDGYSKAQILDGYLNSVYFGENAYGVGAASERYFGIPPRRLDVAQASLLAGLIQAPSLYDPYRDPALARARQADVLRSLVRTGALDVAAATRVLARPLPLRSGIVLAPLRGVDLASGAPFVWWQLLAGVLIVVAAAGALAVPWPHRGRLVRRLVLLAVVVVGAAAIVRSFRSA